MYVLPPPPPPRHPINSIPLSDTNNSITRPQGPQHNLALSEGIYSLRDELQLGAVPPHPSEPPQPPSHILDPKPVPATSGVKLSLAIIAPRKTSPRLRRIPTRHSATSTASQSTPDADSSKSSSDLGSKSFSNFTSTGLRVIKLGEGNAALNGITKESKDALKRRKPKNSIIKSSSSFVSRVIPHEGLSKRLAERSSDGLFAFLNTNRAFLWLDLSSDKKAEQLAKILFTKAHALCHDLNESTRTAAHLDVAIGFNTADIIWYEPMSQRYSRLNKNGIITPSPVSDLRWIPNNDNLFVTAHFDGTLVVLDKEKEDAPFVPEMQLPSNNPHTQPRLRVRKSVQSKNQKHNPVALYKLSNQRINGLSFSPDGQYLACACEDGALRILDLASERLVDLQPSYYGGMTCVAWSPDAQYILTGSQDDLVSVWSVADRALVARCLGHRSWITCLAFDPWRCDELGNYRFASVGEDCHLLLWDFNVGMLNRPRAASIRQSVSSSLRPSRTHSQITVQHIDTHANGNVSDTDPSANEPMTHEVAPRGEVAMLPPVLHKEVSSAPLSWVGFEGDSLLVACRSGRIRTYDRPNDEFDTSTTNGNPFSLG